MPKSSARGSFYETTGLEHKKLNYWFSCFRAAALRLLLAPLAVGGYRTNFFMLSQTFQQLLQKTKFLHALYTSCFMISPPPLLCEWVEDFGGCYNNEFIWYAHKFVRGGRGIKEVQTLVRVGCGRERQNCWVNVPLWSVETGGSCVKIFSIFSVQIVA